MKIGELSRRTGTEAVTIRFYEQKGLLPPPSRDANGYRRYSDAHVDRLLFIRHCRNMDMGLNEISELLAYRDHPDASCGKVNDIVDHHLARIHEKIEHLKLLEKQLIHIRQQCNKRTNPELQASACGILKTLSRCEDEVVCEGHEPFRKR